MLRYQIIYHSEIQLCFTLDYQELIYGPFQQGSDDYIGRGKEKFFLYEIVANKTNSIDVDKVSAD